MSKQKLGMYSFDIDIKFKDKAEAKRYAKRLIENIRYISKKNNWSATAMVCISNIKGSSSFVYNEHTGKVGRPRKIKEIHPGKEKYINVDWHIHVIVASKPSSVFKDEIKKYLDKNWYKDKQKPNIDIKKFYGKGVYKKNTNIKKAEYFINQAEEILFCTCNNGNEVVIPAGYSLKDLYNAFINSQTATKYACTYGNKKRLALINKYDEIANFYWNITKEQDKKIVDKFMKNMQLIKIAENCERIEKKNKEQKNLNLRRRKIIRVLLVLV